MAGMVDGNCLSAVSTGEGFLALLGSGLSQQVKGDLLEVAGKAFYENARGLAWLRSFLSSYRGLGLRVVSLGADEVAKCLPRIKELYMARVEQSKVVDVADFAKVCELREKAEALAEIVQKKGEEVYFAMPWQERVKSIVLVRSYEILGRTALAGSLSDEVTELFAAAKQWKELVEMVGSEIRKKATGASRIISRLVPLARLGAEAVKTNHALAVEVYKSLFVNAEAPAVEELPCPPEEEAPEASAAGAVEGAPGEEGEEELKEKDSAALETGYASSVEGSDTEELVAMSGIEEVVEAPTDNQTFWGKIARQLVLPSGTEIPSGEETEAWVKKNWDNLTTLDLSGLGLDVLPQGFVLPPSVTKLNLSGNRLSCLTGLASASLIELNLSGNPVRVDEKLVGAFPNMKDLNLSNCRIKKLPPRIFASLSLEKLDLSGNPLTHWRTACDESNVAKLDLSGTRINTVHVPKRHRGLEEVKLLDINSRQRMLKIDAQFLAYVIEHSITLRLDVRFKPSVEAYCTAQKIGIPSSITFE